MAKVIYKGMASPDDSVYKGGYHIITGKNINPGWLKLKREEKRLKEEEARKKSK